MAKRLAPKVEVEENGPDPKDEEVNKPEPVEEEVKEPDPEPVEEVETTDEPVHQSLLQTTPPDEEPPLTRNELIEIRWAMFGKCPHCGFYVKGWTPGAFDAQKYQMWEKEGRDGLTGHSVDCDHKYLRMP